MIVDDDVDINDDEIHDIPLHDASTATSNNIRSSETTSKRKMAFTIPTSKSSKSIACMIRKTLEEVIEERHTKGQGAMQTTLENYTRSMEKRKG